MITSIQSSALNKVKSSRTVGASRTDLHSYNNHHVSFKGSGINNFNAPGALEKLCRMVGYGYSTLFAFDDLLRSGYATFNSGHINYTGATVGVLASIGIWIGTFVWTKDSFGRKH